jgi:DNA-binding NtrC family response regulator
MSRILLVFSHAEASAFVAGALSGQYEIATVATAEDALERITENDYAVLVTNDVLDDTTGEALAARAKSLRPNLRVVITSTPGGADDAIRNHGAEGVVYVDKPLSVARIQHAARLAFERAHLEVEVAALKARLGEDEPALELVGSSMAIEHLHERIAFVAGSDAHVLVTGEVGTGRRVVAREVHRKSRRSSGPLFVVDCETTPVETLAQELFGVVRPGAGGDVEVRGKFDLARGGTLVVAEIGYMEPELQETLLGAMGESRGEVRVIATTRHDLKERVQSGAFLRALLYAVDAFGVEVPSLRDRRQDVPMLVARTLRLVASELAIPEPRISPDALDRLTGARWKGNVRELQNVLRRAATRLGAGEAIETTDLQIAPSSTSKMDMGRVEHTFRFGSVREMEKLMILNRLEENEQNRTRSAESLEISVRTLRNKLHEYNIPSKSAARRARPEPLLA